MLRIPPKPEYMITVRLAASSLAERSGFDMEQIEDIKTAVAEACLLLLNRGCEDALEILFHTEGAFQVEISSTMCSQQNHTMEEELSMFLLTALVDDVKISDQNTKQSLTLIKRF
ncbi:MAG: ATP-binding protein [Bacillota bacterium]